MLCMVKLLHNTQLLNLVREGSSSSGSCSGSCSGSSSSSFIFQQIYL